MAETWSERRARERARDAIKGYAAHVAEHVAGANMVQVEATGEPWPVFKFHGYWEAVRCDCGFPMTPLPTFHKRFGILLTYYCPVCDLDGLVAQAIEIHAHAKADAG